MVVSLLNQAFMYYMEGDRNHPTIYRPDDDDVDLAVRLKEAVLSPSVGSREADRKGGVFFLFFSFLLLLLVLLVLRYFLYGVFWR